MDWVVDELLRMPLLNALKSKKNLFTDFDSSSLRAFSRYSHLHTAKFDI
jgi:hypothetical protein